MSLSPPAESGAGGGGNGTAQTVRVPDQPATPHSTIRRFGRRPLSLRARLVATQIFLLAVVSLVIAVSTDFALRSYMVGHLDVQLRAAAGRDPGRTAQPPGNIAQPPIAQPPIAQSPSNNEPPGAQPMQGHDRLNAPGTVPGTLVARISNDTVDARYLDPATVAAKTVPTAADPVLRSVSADTKSHTVNLGAELGDYLVRATRTPDGEVLITGLSLNDVYNTRLTVDLILFGVAGGGLLTAGLTGTFIVRRTLRPLGRVADTAAKVTEIPLHRGDVALQVRVPQADADPRTEVGQVGVALNHMLGHVADALCARQASETRVRQFLADASHELRTPLAAIRGYAELSRRSQDGVPPEIAHALRRIESESARMTNLVEDLLLLARLDSGRPLDREPVDLTRLVVDAVSDAHIAGPEHNWRLDLPDEPVIVTGDGQRLHQVLANLLANARNHTRPGTTVSTRISIDNGEFAIMSVVDNGPGIPPDLGPKVFDRFARGDSSRSRAAGSTGLGLSIVSAVVNAHHGSVSVASRPGRTEFDVRLPLAQPAGEQSPREQTTEPLPGPAVDRQTHSTITQPTHSNATSSSNIETEHSSA